MEKWINFQTLYLTKFLICSVDVSMGTVSGKTHIKTILTSISFVTYSAALRNSVIQLIHILHFS
jgi:hypothetical protein